MAFDISAQQLYKIQLLVAINGNYTSLPHSAEETKRRLFLDAHDDIEVLLKYAFDVDPVSFSEEYRKLKMGQSNLEEILKYRPSIIGDALQLYQTDKEEELLLLLFDKPMAEMTGYEYSILMKRIIKQSRSIFRGNK